MNEGNKLNMNVRLTITDIHLCRVDGKTLVIPIKDVGDLAAFIEELTQLTGAEEVISRHNGRWEPDVN